MTDWVRLWHDMPTDPAEALHAFSTMALRPRSPSLRPDWTKAYGLFRKAGFSRDHLDQAIEELYDLGIFSDDFPTTLTRRADLGGRLTQSEWSKVRIMVFERDGHVCTYCGSTEQLECDHIVPVSRGGGNDLMNLTTACRSCNRSKGDKLVSEWSQ